MTKRVIQSAKLALAAALVSAALGVGGARASGASGGTGLRNLPLLFEPAAAAGAAQDDATGTRTEEPLFVARGSGYDLQLFRSGAVFAAGGTLLRLRFLGANLAAPPEPVDSQPARISYFVGKDSSQWRVGAPAFGRIRYREVYPGIDVEFYGRRDHPEFDFVVHPGADPAVIRLALEGAGRIETGDGGDLTAYAGGFPVHLRVPRIYQPGSPDKEIAGGFKMLEAGVIGFELARHDPERPLVIDPVLTFSTFLGGAYGDNAYDVALDSEGNVYVAGVTHEIGFLHTAGAVSAPPGQLVHAFVAKLNPSGAELEYAAVIGGALNDQARAIAVDAEGNAYLAGSTFSTDFPVTADALQPDFGGGNTDVFVVKLSADGSQLLYSTYLGGSRQEIGEGIAVDSSGNIFTAGSTLADNFPVLPSSLQKTKSSYTYDGFVARIDMPAGALAGSTYLGGAGRDEIFDLALDGAGNAVVSGMTVSKDFPTTPGVFQPVHAGITTAFVAKLNADLTGMLFSTFLGGSRDERGQTLAIDSAGDIYVGGRTLSTDFPATPGAFQPQFVRGSYFGDGFVAKLAGDGSELIYATYLGGSSEDEIKGIAIDTTGEVIVVGGTGSPDFPVTADALQPSLRGLDDLFIARLSADGSELLYSTLFGGGKSDSAYAIATDGRGGAVVAGTSVSSDLPVTPGALQSQLLGATTGGDIVVVRLDRLFSPAISAAGIVNAASMLPGAVAPGEIITIFGVKLAAANPAFAELTEDGLLSNILGDTRVLFDGVAAPLISTSPGQVSAAVPYAVAGNAVVEIQVEYLGVASDAVSAPVAPASPALFTLNSQGHGPAAAFNQDFQLNTADKPAERGSVVILFGTGEGETDVAVDGLPAAAPLPQPLLPVSVTIGGIPAEVLYAGGAPGLVAGVVQINAVVPGDVVPGAAVPVAVRSGAIQGPATATLAIR